MRRRAREHAGISCIRFVEQAAVEQHVPQLERCGGLVRAERDRAAKAFGCFAERSARALDRGEPGRSSHRCPGFRLPSESELEYLAREGSAVRFVNDGAKTRAQTGKWPDVNALGLESLSLGEWAADSWHDTYDGAPSDGAAWAPNGVPGVFRGALPWGPDQSDDELLFGLAAYRGEPREDVDERRSFTMRLVRDLAR
jgi:hypothetical protein